MCNLPSYSMSHAGVLKIEEELVYFSLIEAPAINYILWERTYHLIFICQSKRKLMSDLTLTKCARVFHPMLSLFRADDYKPPGHPAC